jgi:ERF superfamily
VQRSSPSIGTLASALAKAQGELVNPEKSMVATIRGDGPRRTDQSFRYAPLSSGLDIVRKVLGQHEIATVQTTSIDQDAGLINLTTVLAHASGEWIASDWPVCAISETATPHRMGAALTYARRYALFTLVGIAGEDDLDAPNLATPTAKPADWQKPHRSDGRLNGGETKLGQPTAFRSDAKSRPRPPSTILAPEASAQVRDRLTAEIAGLATNDDAALWAHRSLGEKNMLIAADANCVERAFDARLQALGTDLDARPTAWKRRSRSKRIDKSLLQLPEARRVRDRDHVKLVAQQPCLICGRRPADAHHLRFTQNRAMARKASDEFTVPLCRGHHREAHRSGDEAVW